MVKEKYFQAPVEELLVKRIEQNLIRNPEAFKLQRSKFLKIDNNVENFINQDN